MASLFQALRWGHIAAGACALILFWIPALAAKGGKLHVRAGWCYAACILIVGLTALAMSALMFTLPLIRPVAKSLPPAELADYIRTQRLFATFLAYLAGVTLTSGWQGILSVEAKGRSTTLRAPVNIAINVLIIVGGLTVLILGIHYRSGPLLGLSPIGPFLGSVNLHYLLRKGHAPLDWWFMHLRSMIATGIAAYTAFLVFGGARLLPTVAHSPLYTLLWVLPTVVGVPAIVASIVHYQRKFGTRARVPESDTQTRPA